MKRGVTIKVITEAGLEKWTSDPLFKAEAKCSTLEQAIRDGVQIEIVDASGAELYRTPDPLQ